MLKAGVLIFLSAIGSIANAQQSDFLKYSHRVKGDRIVSNGLFSESAPSIEEIKENLSRFDSDVSFLSYLKSNYPKLTENFVLIHASESQQLSSFAHPRIIVFGGGSAFAFSDEPSQKDRRVEILNVDPRTYETSLHEIKFENSVAQLHSNPKSCVACHGSPARPLWNPYDFWPNSFGSAVGQIGTKQEAEAYDSLYRQSTNSDLLRQLNVAKSYDYESEDVTAFTQYIGKLNYGRWIAKNLKPGSFDAFAKPLIALGSMCIYENEGANYQARPSLKKLKKYFASDDFEKALPLLETIRNDQIASRQRFKKFLDFRLTELFPNPEFIFRVDHSRLENEVETLAIMRWLFTLGGVDSSDLSSSLIANDTLVSLPADFAAEFVVSLFELRPDLFKGFKYRSAAYGGSEPTLIQADCKSIQAASAREPKKANSQIPFRVFSEDNPVRPALSRCSKCHVEHLADHFRAPSIPFNDPIKLAAILRAEGSTLKVKIRHRINTNDPSRMPPSHPLSAEEREGVMAFLENLER